MKCYLIIAFIGFTGLTANAQTRYRTDESIRSQIMNGTAPGFLFSKAAPAKKEHLTKPVNAGSISTQIRSNTMPGLLYKQPATPAQLATEANVQPRPDTSAAGSRNDLNQKLPEKAPFNTTAD